MIVSESRFLALLFAELEKQEILYAVLRNSDTLPESLGGSDLDLLVENRKQAEQLLVVAQNAALSCGGKLVCRYVTGALVACFLGKGRYGWWGCHIDVFIGLHYYGRVFADAHDLLSRRVKMKDSFYCLGDETDVVSFVKEILYNGKTRKDYYPRAQAVYRTKPLIVESAFKDSLSEGYSILTKLLSESVDSDQLKAASVRMAKMLCRKHPLKGAWSWTLRWCRLFLRPGFCVAFLGTDGSGKSTLIENVKPPLEQMLHGKVHYEHLRPNLLPSLARLAGNPRKAGPTTDPHGGRQAGWIMSIIRFAYYYVDYTLGFWIKIYPILIKRPSLVFFDRYYYEYMLDQRRCAVRLFPGFARFFSWFIPKPDLILCLGGSPEKIFARKPETTLEEVGRQVMKLRRFCSGNKRGVWIDTTVGIENSRDRALGSIVKAMAGRYKNEGFYHCICM